MPTEARNLKSTVIETENNKNNLKTVATQIDNKLVELGGEQATDLSDVVNKMQKMSEEYLKYAYIRNYYKKFDDFSLCAPANDWGEEVVLEFDTNFSFIPKTLFIKIFGKMKAAVSGVRSFSGDELTNYRNNTYRVSFYQQDYELQLDMNILSEKKSEIRFKARNVGASAYEDIIYVEGFSIENGLEAFSKEIQK